MENIKNIVKHQEHYFKKLTFNRAPKVHVSIFWRMKRHLAKLKAAKATSHGTSTVTGHGESTTGAKGASKDYLGFWSGAIPPCSGLVVLCARCFKIARAVEFVKFEYRDGLNCIVGFLQLPYVILVDLDALTG